jgi:hypothetical protein
VCNFILSYFFNGGWLAGYHLRLAAVNQMDPTLPPIPAAPQAAASAAAAPQPPAAESYEEIREQVCFIFLYLYF